MRNYFALNLARLWYNHSTPADPPDGYFLIAGTSVNDLNDQITWAIGQASVALVEIQNEGIWYFPLDKLNLTRIWNYAILGFPFNGPIYPRAPENDEAKTFQPEPSSPKRGWSDAAGIVRKPAPSDEQKNTQIGNVIDTGTFAGIVVTLQTEAAQLLKMRSAQLRRIGEIITYQLGLMFAGRKSLVDVLVYLQPYQDEVRALLNG